MTATGTYREPIAAPRHRRVAIELETTFDRRDFGFDWQMELPSGGDVLAWDVTPQRPPRADAGRKDA